MIRRRVSVFDDVVAKFIGKLPRVWYRVFVIVGALIRPGLWIGLLLLIALAFWYNGLHQYALDMLVGAAVIPVSTLLKLIFRRQRPATIYTENMRVKSYSFPSSHSYSAAVAAVSISAAVAFAMPALAVYAAVVLGLIALFVGVSRVYVGAHYPSDVVGGLLLGGAVSALVLAVVL